jgi:CRISPR-associated endonuclease/helicase Cas3
MPFSLQNDVHFSNTSVMSYFAHSGSPDDKSDWQSLKNHALRVAALASERAQPFGLERAAHLAGLLHDLGKYTAPFQRRLSGANIRVDHSTAGAATVLDLVGADARDRLVAQLVAYGILGHHAGLPNRLEGDGSYDKRIEGFAGDASRVPDAIWREELAPDATKLFPPGFSPADGEEKKFQYAFMARMIFSCLVDADFRDTEDFYSTREGLQKDRVWASLQESLATLIAAFDAHMARFQTDGALNRLRSDILAHVRSMAAEMPGLFTLTVPTGGGKTLASLGFALDHARAHGHRRIIYAIPFTSIIDQTAATFKEVLGEAHVLEHHSAIDEERFDRQKRDATSRDKLKLAMEDWAAPVVVTTNVQFFESLFAAKTSRARKLHNIAGSVIILDEAQTIPLRLLLPCLRVLRELTRNYGCSVILCTATQPAVDEANLKGGLPLVGRELAPDPLALSQALRRATIVRGGSMSNADLIAALQHGSQALVIVNSRKHALELYREAQAAELDGLVHLTTRMYAAHRREILDGVRSRLKGDAPCRVIATSLIEAGVDVDFPRVWRAEAGLDQIVQAAGRCNREGRRPVADSIVTVFEPVGYAPPRDIKGLIGDMTRANAAGADLLSLAAMQRYFEEVYWRFGADLDDKKILEKFAMSGRPPRDLRTEFEFRDVARDFRMIESGMEPVVVPLDQTAVDCVNKLAVAELSSGALARKLQSFIVQVPPRARAMLIANGHVAFERSDLRGDQFAVLQTMSLYKMDVGLLWDDGAYLAAEDSII